MVEVAEGDGEKMNLMAVVFVPAKIDCCFESLCTMIPVLGRYDTGRNDNHLGSIGAVQLCFHLPLFHLMMWSKRGMRLIQDFSALLNI